MPLFAKKKKAPKIKIYTLPSCGHCHAAKDFMKEKKLAFTEVDVSANIKAAKEMIEVSKQMGVPVITVDGTIVVGFDKAKFAKLVGV